MKRGQRWLLAICSMIGIIFFAASPSPAQPSSTKTGDRLSWVSSRPGLPMYVSALGLTQLINSHTDLQVTLRPMANMDSAIKAMHTGQAEVGEVNVSMAYSYTYGIQTSIETRITEACREFRMLLGANTFWWGWLARPNLGIEKISDLKGRTVNYLTPGHEIKKAIGEDSLRAAGINPEKDLNSITMESPIAAMTALGGGKIDASMDSLGGTKLLELIAEKKAVCLPFSQEVYNNLRDDLKNMLMVRELPAGYLPVLHKQMPVVGMRKIVMCREDLSERAAHLITKTIMEKARELDKIAPDFKEYGVLEYAFPPDFVIPFHPGSVRYFKEAGLWSQAYELRQQDLLARLQKK